LFSQARGLVTDVGGVLAHGSIVAREYDIPAVLGTGVATRRIQAGQRIHVDGDAGTVTLLDGADDAVDERASGEPGSEMGTFSKARKALLLALAAGTVIGAATLGYYYRRHGKRIQRGRL
jgi:pyruvate,water dikinase